MNEVVIVIFVLINCIFGADLPPEIPTCKPSDLNFKDCLRSSAQIAIGVLAKGYKGLKIPQLDPLVLKEVVMEPVPGPINIYQKYTDITLDGASGGTIENFEVNLDGGCSIWLYHKIPIFNTTADYELKGQLLLLPVNAQGNFKATTYDSAVNISANCEKFQKDNTEYIKITSTTVKFLIPKIKFDFGSLIAGNPELDNQIHKVIDDNPLDFFEVMRPSCETIWGAAVMNILNNVFKHVPLKKLFP